MRAAEAGLGFSRFVSVGNQADVGIPELVAEFAAHPETELIAVYAEDVRDGRAFAATAAEAGKPVVLLAIAHGEATARAVASHTGALASDAAAIDAACAAAGIERVRTPSELIDAADGLLRAGPLGGRRIAVLSDGGGHGGIAASLVEEAGLDAPRLSDVLAAELRADLPPTAAVGNPIDLAGGGEQDVRSFDRTAAALLRSGEVDAVLLTGYFGGYATYGEPLASAELDAADALAAAARATGRPVIVQAMHPRSDASERLRSGGVPVLETIERAVAICARLAARGAREPRGVPVAARAGAAGRGRRLRRRACAARRRGDRLRRRRARSRAPRRRSPPRPSWAIPSCSRRWARCTSPMRAASPSGLRTPRRSPRPPPTWRGGSPRPRSASSGWRRSPTASSC